MEVSRDKQRRYDDDSQQNPQALWSTGPLVCVKRECPYDEHMPGKYLQRVAA